MKLVMTQDYAALVVGVDIALLVVGTVQILGLLKEAAADAKRNDQQQNAALKVISERLQTGDEPTPSELQAAASPGSRLPAFGLIGLGWVWVMVCINLFFCVTCTVFWSASKDNKPDPWLASFTAWTTAVSATLLLVETAIHSIRLLNAIGKDEEADLQAGMSPAHYREADRKVSQYRRSQHRTTAR